MYKILKLTILLKFTLFFSTQAQISDTSAIKPYKEYGYNDRLIMEGFLKNDVEDSIWTFYDFKGEIQQKYDFRKKELVYYKLTDHQSNMKFALKETGNEKVTLDRPPLYIGGEVVYYSKLSSQIKYPIEAQKNRKSGRVIVGFYIDQDGKTSNYQILKKAGYGMDEEALRVLKLINTNWIPAIYNGKPVGVEYFFPVVFQLN